jgi:hypothetical protein
VLLGTLSYFFTFTFPKFGSEMEIYKNDKKLKLYFIFHKSQNIFFFELQVSAGYKTLFFFPLLEDRMDEGLIAGTKKRVLYPALTCTLNSVFLILFLSYQLFRLTFQTFYSPSQKKKLQNKMSVFLEVSFLT